MIGHMDGQRLGIMIDGDVGRTAESHFDAERGAAAAGE